MHGRLHHVILDSPDPIALAHSTQRCWINRSPMPATSSSTSQLTRQRRAPLFNASQTTGPRPGPTAEVRHRRGFDHLQRSHFVAERVIKCSSRRVVAEHVERDGTEADVSSHVLGRCHRGAAQSESAKIGTDLDRPHEHRVRPMGIQTQPETAHVRALGVNDDERPHVWSRRPLRQAVRQLTCLGQTVLERQAE
jgi:hypothetical protein